MEGLVLRREAAVYRCALISGMVERSEVIAWADAWIGRLDGYPDALVGVSMGTSREYDLFASLAELAEPFLSSGFFPPLCRIMTAFLTKYPERLETATQLLMGLAIEGSLSQDLSQEAYRFDDALNLAKDGIFDMKVVQDEVLAFLRLHGN